MAVIFNDNLEIRAPKHIDSRTSGLFAPYNTIAEANAAITYRVQGLTVQILKSGVNTEYWYRDGTNDNQLIEKTGSSFLEVAPTLSAVSIGNSPRLIYVQTDETNNGDKSLYIHTGTDFKFLLTVS